MTDDRTQRLLTSRSVFDSFTYRNRFGDLTHENIISKECFAVWLGSRSGKPKHPEGAFRRTIHAHLRAADGRSPFAKDVEQSLLKKLRSIKRDGKPVDPFAQIFGRARTFRKHYKGGWYTDFSYPYGYHEKHLSKKKNETIVKSRRISSCLNVEDNEKYIEKVLQVSKEQMDIYMKEVKKTSFNFSFPAVAYLVNFLSAKSYFFSPAFILPTREEQNFDKNKPICYGVLAPNSEKIEYVNETFKQCFGTVSHLLHLSPTVIEFFQVRRLIMKELSSKEKVWSRGTLLFQNKRFGFKSFCRLSIQGGKDFFFQIDYNSVIQDELLDKLLL
eukprot:maker-scaffold_12-snap-gene-4.47-mRNA-1 protein AED:0.00 eAED:0.00 QI:139/1/0.75/1/1/1/4/547/328